MNFKPIQNREPMLRYEMTMTEFEIMLFLYERPRDGVEVAKLLSVEPRATAVYMHRLKTRGYVESKKRVYSQYWLTQKGLSVIEGVGKRIAGQSQATC